MATPAPPPDINALRNLNLESLDAMTKSLQRLKELRPQAAANPVLQDHIESEISTLELEMRITTIVQTHLQAAGITVKPLDPATVLKLQTLSVSIDEAIKNDATASASLADVTTLIETATSVRDIVKSSIAVPA